MNSKHVVAALVLLGSASAFAKQQATAQKGAEAISVNLGEIQWGAAPPQLPKGAQMAVMHGYPSKKETFSLRLKLPAGYKVPPHWHTNAEQLTILSGSFVLHMGDTMDAPAHTLTAGGFHYLPARMHHAAEASEETIVQVDGMGPFDIHYLNPADNPAKQAQE